MTTSPDRWGTVERVYHAALARPVDERAVFLAEACAGDEGLRREVESLLAQDMSAAGVLSGGAVVAAAGLVSDVGHSTLVGRRIGVYQILAPIGAGGMGEVYRARDTRLGRDVAIKVLPSRFTSHPDRLARFEREARVLASLNHPHVAAIYGFEDAPAEAGGHVHALILELVEGETLADRIARNKGGLPPAEALQLARQIAEALDAAHEKGIVHRDLKPANIKIAPGGMVKVLDFGLAKLDERTAASGATASPTITAGATADGVVMGTAAYMSPEQARGQAVDNRTDVWAFGCVMFEMLAGVSPFGNPTAVDTLAAIVEREPTWDMLPASTPAHVLQLLRRCLNKDPKRRLRHIADARLELEDGPATMPIRGWSAPRKAIASLLAVLALTSVAALYSLLRPGPPADSIAVLPFVNVGGNPDMEYLSDGITESLINALSEVPALAVMSRNAVFRYKGPTVDAQAAGRRLNVQVVLTGSVVQRDGALSISTELVDVRNNRHLWGERYNRRVTDILAVQEEISTAISDTLRLRLTGEEKQRFVKQYTQNTEAYQLYLKGRYYWNKKTADGFYKGIDYFQQAIALDPNYAPAYAGLAALYNNLANYNFALIPPREAWPKAKAAAERALQIDDNLAAAHASAALVSYQWAWDWANAEKEFRRAIDLAPASSSTYEPTLASTYHWYAHYLMSMGRTEESFRAGRRALELDPLDLGNNAHQGWHYLFAGQHDQAVEPLRKAVELDPTFAISQWYLGMAYEQQKAFAEAIKQFDTCIRLTGGRPSMVALLGHAYAAAGRTKEAETVLDQLATRATRTYVPPYPVAVIHAALGRPDQAFAWLEKAYNERDSWLDYLTVDPRLSPLRSDPRYADLRRRMNLP
jgi:eukaryotic-like serine/threonine-protein kinase